MIGMAKVLHIIDVLGYDGQNSPRPHSLKKEAIFQHNFVDM